MKLTKSEKAKIEMQMTTVRRGDTWVGLRPSTMESRKYNRKAIRRDGKSICRAYC